MRNSSYLSASEDGIECSETLAYKIQTPGNHPDEKAYAIFFINCSLCVLVVGGCSLPER